MKRDCVIGPHNYAVRLFEDRPSSIQVLDNAKKDATGQIIQLTTRKYEDAEQADEDLLKEAVRSADELCGENTFAKDNSQAVQDFVKTLKCRGAVRIKTLTRKSSKVMSRAHVDG